jgi:spore coat protein U-like protein
LLVKLLDKVSGALFIIAATIALFTTDAFAQSCRVTILNHVDFGIYDTLASGNLDTTGNIRIQCRRHTRIPSYTVTIGADSRGSFLPRQMSNGPDRLNYNLYLDSGYSTIWGDGTSGTSPVTVAPARANATFTVYGRSPLGQDVSLGIYSDVVTVTVEF